MNAVEYCLLHGLKLAGAEHPALLSAGEVLSYGALERCVSQFAAGLRDAGVKPNDRVGDADARHAGHHCDASVGDGGGRHRRGDVEPGFGPEELDADTSPIVRPSVLVIDAEFEETGSRRPPSPPSSPRTNHLIHRDRELAAWKSQSPPPRSCRRRASPAIRRSG